MSCPVLGRLVGSLGSPPLPARAHVCSVCHVPWETCGQLAKRTPEPFNRCTMEATASIYLHCILLVTRNCGENMDDLLEQRVKEARVSSWLNSLQAIPLSSSLLETNRGLGMFPFLVGN